MLGEAEALALAVVTVFRCLAQVVQQATRDEQGNVGCAPNRLMKGYLFESRLSSNASK